MTPTKYRENFFSKEEKSKKNLENFVDENMKKENHGKKLMFMKYPAKIRRRKNKN